jgi:hypothetical protein
MIEVFLFGIVAMLTVCMVRLSQLVDLMRKLEAKRKHDLNGYMRRALAEDARIRELNERREDWE